MLFAQRLRLPEDRQALADIMQKYGFSLPQSAKPSTNITTDGLHFGWASLERSLKGAYLFLPLAINLPLHCYCHSSLQL